jgi:hypothetical protein
MMAERLGGTEKQEARTDRTHDHELPRPGSGICGIMRQNAAEGGPESGEAYSHESAAESRG